MRASLRLSLVACWWLVISGWLLATGARAEQITTTPLQFYGLGTLTCAAWSPDGTKIVTGGSAGAFLWDVATSRVIRMFIGHTKEVVAVAISPDGSKVLTGSADGTARLWSVHDATTIRTFFNFNGRGNSLAFLPDGTKVLIGENDRTVRLLSIGDGSVAKTFPGPFGDILCVAAAADGTEIAFGSSDNKARTWDALTGVLIVTLDCGSRVTCLAFSPDGTKILTGTDNSAELWNLADSSLFWTATWNGIHSAAFSPDSQRAFMGTQDGWVLSGETTGGSTIRFFYAGVAPVGSVGVSPDGEWLLTSSGTPQNAARIWPVSNLPLDTVFSGHRGPVYSAALSPDETKVVTGSGDITARLWNASDGTEIRAFVGHGYWIWSVAFSPDGTKVLTGSDDQTAKLWDASSGTLLSMFSGHMHCCRSVAFSPDGTQVLTGSLDKTAKLWNAADGTEIRTFSGHTTWVNSVAFSPDGTKVLTGSGDYWSTFGEAKLWNASDATEIRTFSGHTATVSSVAFSPDGARILTGSDDRTAKVWKASDGALVRVFSGHANAVNSVAFSPDGTMGLTGSSDTTAKLWTVLDGTEIRTFSGHTAPVLSVAFSPDGTKVLTASEDGTARLWQIAPTAPGLAGHMSPLTSVAVSGDQAAVATGHQDGTARVWNMADATLIGAFAGHTRRVNCVALSSTGTLLATGSDDNTAKVWNVIEGQLIRTLVGHTGRVNSVAFSSDAGQALTASDDGMAVLWRTADGAALRVFSGHGGAVYAATISNNSGLVLTGGIDNTAQLWNRTTGARLQTFSGHTGAVLCVALSADGTRILTGSGDTTAKLWDANTGSLLRTFTGHTSPVLAVGFSPDDSRIMTAGDTTTKIWKTADGTLLQTIQHYRPVTGAALSGDGTRIVTGSEDAMGRLWSAFPSGGSVSSPTLSGDSFIIVSGGGNFIGNPIVGQTQALADRAFFTCLVRGYKRDEIRYLSAFGDWQTRDSNGDGLPDADAQATTQNFWSAIDQWSSGTARLFVYLVDHGSYNPTTGQWYFRLNQNDYINAHDLDAHLDALQAATGCEVVLIVDACYSGGFVQECTATSGTRRVVVSSTTPTDLSIYTPPVGAESFSFFFFSFAILGNTIENCYDWTDLAFQAMGNPAGQRPWMDDDNDGDSDKWDGKLAARHVLGRYPAFGLNAPTITDVAATRTVALGESAVLWAQLSEAVAAKEVWALLIPQGVSYTSSEPVTNLARVNLARSATPNRWQATLWPAAQKVGSFSVVYFAMSEDALKTRLLATPVAAGLTILSGGYEARFDVAASAVSEGVGTANLLLRLSKPATWAVTLNYTAGGTATPGVDHARLPGSATFSAGQTSKTIPIIITDDTIDEPNETVVVTLTGAMGAALGATKVHTLTIQDNDPTPTVSFSAASVSVSESAGTVNLTLLLSAASASTVTVNYSVGGTATAGVDYAALPGSITIAPGRTARYLPVTIIDDQEDEPNETVIVTLTSATSATVGATRAATLTIRGNDLPTAILRWPLYR